MQPDAFVEQLIQALDLQPLPGEGGLYRQTWESPLRMPAMGATAAAATAGGQKPLGTAIFYLLTNQADSFSALHRLPVDELWHFYLGDPLEMTLLYADGSSRQVILGQDILHGQQVQFVAPGKIWQGTRLLPGGRFALAGTTMAPGFIPEDYEGGLREDLLANYPAERERILALTRR